MTTRATLEDLLRAHNPGVQRTTLAVLEAIERLAPDLHRKVLPGWRAVGFTHPSSGFLCAVFPYADRVDIAFETGTRLEDPWGVLRDGKTSTKRVRYWSLAPDETPDDEALESFLEQSVLLKEVRR
jgi:hypothetical protein